MLASIIFIIKCKRSVGQIDYHDFKGVRFLYNRRERQRTTSPWFTFEKKKTG